MKNPLKFWLGTLTVFLLALTPSVVPEGGSVAPAAASSVETDQYLSLPDTSDAGTGTGLSDGVTANGVIPATGDFTAEAWILPESLNNANVWHQVFQQSGANASNFGRFGLNLKTAANSSSAGFAGVQVIYDGINLDTSNSANHPRAQVYEGRWTHIAVSVDWDPSTTAIRLYLNGVEVASTTGNPNNDQIRTDGFTVGYFPENFDTTDRHFHGGIDQVKVWEGILSQSQIQQSMNVHAAAGVSSAPNLRAHLDFNGDYLDSTGLIAFTTVGSVSRSEVAQTATIGNDTVLTFPRSYLTSQGGWSVPTGVSSVNYLVAGGGGGGGTGWDGAPGGGGGAGALFRASTAVTAGSSLVVEVGAGGLAGIGGGTTFNPAERSAGSDGASSRFGDITASGGGGGGQAREGGQAGGSGGGAGGRHNASPDYLRLGGAGSAAGNSGGDSQGSGSGAGGGGGGGAGGAGSSAIVPTGGTGGPGVQNDISGANVTYAVGGSGGDFGVGADVPGVDAAFAGSGGSGGSKIGGGSVAGGDGSAGIVILRYVTPTAPGTIQNFSADIRYVDADADNDSVTLRWDALTAQTPAVTSYEIEYSTSSSFAGTPQTRTVSVTDSAAATPASVTLTDLDDGKRYFFRIKARNAVGLSASYADSSSIAVSREDFALDFNRSNASSPWAAAVSSTSRVIPNGNFTFEAWIRPSSKLSSFQTIFFQGTQLSDRLALFLYNDNTLHIGRGSNWANIGVGDITGQWSHVAITGDGATGGSTFSVYLNGFLVGTGAPAGGAGAGGGELHIGIDDQGRTLPFDGDIDQVKIWSSQLSATQIQESMHTWDDTDVTGSPTLISHYDFNDNTQSTVLRDMYGSNDLAVTNASTSDFTSIVETPSRTGHDVYRFQRSYLTATGGWTVPSGLSAVDYLIVAGGGGGGGRIGGGGGAGGLLQGEDAPVTAGAVLPIIVGVGGKGGVGVYNSATGDGSNGGDSTALSLTAIGGGGGAGTDTRNGKAGGSGGGAGRYLTATGGAGQAGQGNAGGDSPSSPDRSGGGGGAGGTGASSSVSGNGGVGLESSITGTASFYAGGGGGSGAGVASGTGGTGGGGAGSSTGVGFAGSAGTGGGGGGGGFSGEPGFAGGPGGSGTVVFAAVRSYTLTLDSGGTASTQTVDFGASPPNPGSTRTGFTLLGWSDADDTTAEYAANLSDYTMGAANDTIYAVWHNDLAPLAYEPFSGTSGATAVGGAGSGSSGLSGNWELVLAQKQGSTNALSGVYTSAPNLALPSNTGFSLPSANTALSGPDWHLRYSARELSNQVTFDSDETYYLSFISHVPLVSGSRGSAMVGLLSGLPTTTDLDTDDEGPWSLMVGSPYEGKFGIDYGDANRATWVSGQTRGSVATGTSFSAVGTKVSAPTTEEQAFFVVVKVEAAASGNDRVSLRAFGPSETLPTDDSAISWDVTYEAALTGSGTHLAVETEYNGSIDEFRLGFSYTAVTDARTSYVVTYDSEGGSSVSDGSFLDGLSIASAPTNPTRSGYTFAGWAVTSGGTAVSFPYSPGVSSDITLYALWTINSYTLTLDDLGTTTTQSVTYNANPSDPGSTRLNLTLVGWSDGDDNVAEYAADLSDYTMPASNDTLYAVWKLSTPTAPTVSAPNGNLKQISVSWSAVPSATSYTVKVYNSSDSLVASVVSIAGTSTTITSSQLASIADNTEYRISVTAVGTGNYATSTESTKSVVTTNTTYAITWDVNGGTLAGGEAASFVTGGSVAEPSDPSRSGFDFIGWSTSETSGNGTLADQISSWPYSPGVTSTITLYAIWDSTIAITTPTSGLSGTFDEVFSLTVATSGGPGGNSFSVTTGTLPGGLALNASTGEISGTPTSTGNSTIAVTVTDSSGATAVTSSFTISIAAKTLAAASAPTVSAPAGELKQISVSWASITNASSYTLKVYSSADTLLQTISGVSGTSRTLTSSDYSFADNTAYKVTVTAVGTGNYATSAESSTSSVTTNQTYTVTWDSNGGSSVTSASFVTGGPLAAPSNPTRTGYTFVGWSTTETSNNGDAGSAVSFDYTPPSAADITLYARWSADTNTVTFKSNFSGGPSDDTQNVVTDQATNLSTGVFTRAGHTFVGWDTQADGAGTDYSDGQSITITGDLVLYAQWTISTYTITYSAGDNGTGTNVTTTKTHGVTLVLPDSATANGYFTRTGHTISGWSVNSDGSTTDFALGGNFTTNAADTLYPVWSVVSLEATEDTYVNSGSGAGTNYGTNSALLLKNAVNSITNNFNRVAYAKFEFDPALTWNGGIFELAVTGNNSGGGSAWNSSYTTFNVNVYGADDASWSESTLTFNAADSSAQDWGIDTSSWPWVTNGAEFLGTISIPTSVSTVGNSYGLSTAELDNFLNADADGAVTLFFVRSDTDNRGNLSFASSENTSYAGPTLKLSESGYTYTIAYDINGGTGSLPAPGTFTDGSGTDYTVASPTSLVAPANKEFTAWNTKADGSGTSYDPGDAYNLSRSVTLYAQFATMSFTVTYAAGDNGSGASQTATKTSGVDLTLPNSATANSYFTRAGHTVTAWSVNADGSTSDFALGGTYSTEAADTLYPVWTIDTYAVVFGSGDDASGSNESATKTYNVSFTIPNSATSNSYFSRTGYTITSWSTNSDGSTSDYDFGDSYTTNAALTLYPVWTADTYTITYAKGSVSGSTGSNQTATKTHDIALTLPNSATANGYFTKTGYTVVGWSANEDGSTTDFALGGSYTIEAADTFYPVWEANDYTVTYTYNGATGGNSVTSIVYTVDGIQVSLPTPTRPGYTFEGWHSDSGLTTRVGLGGASYAPTANITLYAKWDEGTYTVIFEYDGATGGNSDDDDTYTTGGTAITLPTPLRTGYTFGGWYSNAGLTTSVGAAGASYAPTSNLTIYARWTAITRSVTYDDTNASAGSVPVDGASYIIGDTVVVKANSGSLRRTGFTFDGWTVAADGSGTVLNAGSTVTVATSDITLYPKWSPITYTISYNLNGGTGDVSGAPTSWQTATSNVSLPTSGITKTGFTFDGWQELGSTTKLNYSYQPNYENVTLVARWTIKTINYTFDEGAASGLSITGWPSDASANFGTTITLPNLSGTTVTISSVSYVFFGWESGGTTYNSGDSYVLGESAPTFTAEWARLFDVRYGFGGGTHSLTGDQDPECDTAGLCVDGESITLRTSPERPGYTFDGWKVQDTATVKNASAPHIVTATGYLFYAQWSAISYQFTFNSMGGSQNNARVENTIGELVTMPSPGTRTGYTFAGWSPDGGSTLYITGSTYVVGVGGQAFVAKWVPDVYTVTYDWQGGAGSTPKVSDAYTVGTGDMSLPTASSAGYTRDGYTFSGWSTTVGGTVVSGFRPTADDILYAVWADGTYTLTYDAQGGSVIATTASITRTTSTILATPTRENFTHIGWFTATSGGTKVGDAGDTFTPTASTTVYARWVQDSLYGVDLATLETGATFTASNSTETDTTISHSPSGTSARIEIPRRSLPQGTNVTVRYFKETDRQSDLIPGDNSYFFALLVSWLLGSGTSATVPDTDPDRPITVTLNNSSIKAGAMVYQVIGNQVTELGRATTDGTVTVELFTDPEIVVAATAPMAPTSVTGNPGDTRATISWTAGSSGGSAITGYTVTASPGGATCSTASTSCTIGSLTNNTAYTFSVRATNGQGTSAASAASSPVTPVGANYTVTFNSNGGSAVSDGSFFSGSTVSAPSSPTRSGFTFEGWSTVQDDDTTAVTFPYAPGVTSAITLFALWEVAPAAPSTAGSGSGGANDNKVTPRSPRAPVVIPRRVLGPTAPVTPPSLFSAPVVIVPERGFDPDSGSQARVGGLPATVTKTTPSQGGVSVGVGRVTVGITPTTPQPSGAGPAPGRPSDVSVSTGQSATVSGGGLLPGSQLQVWLPGLSGDAAKELARIPVKTDGTFESELTFSARQSDTPVPIGRQVIQVTGFDELGNQTIVDMTITIGQGEPSPEPNRSVNALPDLAPGQSLATSAGVPETVTIEARPDTREVAVVSGEWNFNVSLPDDAGEVEQVDSGATITLVQAKTATVSGEGFQPNTRVDIWLFSDPTLLGSVTVSADGAFTGEVFLDARYALVGEHTLQLQGVGVDGFIKAANLGVVVQEPGVGSSDDGMGWALWALFALSGVLVAVLVVVVVRRRSNQS